MIGDLANFRICRLHGARTRRDEDGVRERHRPTAGAGGVGRASPHARRIGLIRRPLMTQIVRRREEQSRAEGHLQSLHASTSSQIHGERPPRLARLRNDGNAGRHWAFTPPPSYSSPSRDGSRAIPLFLKKNPVFGFLLATAFLVLGIAQDSRVALVGAGLWYLGSILWWRRERSATTDTANEH